MQIFQALGLRLQTPKQTLPPLPIFGYTLDLGVCCSYFQVLEYYN